MLINNDGIFNLMHDKILKVDGGSFHEGRTVVSFDSGAVSCPCECAVNNGDSFQIRFVWPFSQASHTRK